MQVFEAVKIWLEYHKTNSREKTLRTYRTILSKFRDEFGERNLGGLTSEEILKLTPKDVSSFPSKRVRFSKRSTARSACLRLSACSQMPSPCSDSSPSAHRAPPRPAVLSRCPAQ